MSRRLWVPVMAAVLVRNPFAEGFSAVSLMNRDHSSLPTTVLTAAASLDSIPNEFSRPLDTDRILRTTSGKQRRSYRDYQTTIEASSDECIQLAKRFELKNLESLKADIFLSLPAHHNGRGGDALTVQVEGSILATLTQTCVRTNDDFEVTVEFPINAIVRPVSSNFESEDKVSDEIPQIKKKKKNKTTTRNDRSYDMLELQQMIGRQMDEFDFTAEDIIEDEAIYSAASGILDVGELVAQAFWLNLDPYPKKPGSGPVEFTISG